jgi:hydroxymethylpyrimidine pyrophosphatase-like HAD family hydrolase
MYKLIAMDLDGTLLNSYGEVSKENKNAIKYAMEKNVQVVIASRKNAKSYYSYSRRNKFR